MLEAFVEATAIAHKYNSETYVTPRTFKVLYWLVLMNSLPSVEELTITGEL